MPCLLASKPVKGEYGRLAFKKGDSRGRLPTSFRPRRSQTRLGVVVFRLSGRAVSFYVFSDGGRHVSRPPLAAAKPGSAS